MGRPVAKKGGAPKAALKHAAMEEKKPNKINIYDASALKTSLDEAAREILDQSGIDEDTTVGNIKILLGLLAIATALYAQFGPGKFPSNWWTVFACVASYVVLTVVLNLYSSKYEGDAFFIANSQRGFPHGLRVSSNMKRYDHQYTLQMSEPAGAGASSRQVSMTLSATEVFHEDGYLNKEAFASRVEQLLQQHQSSGVATEPEKKKQ